MKISSLFVYEKTKSDLFINLVARFDFSQAILVFKSF
jgi:hypothetical protein